MADQVTVAPSTRPAHNPQRAATGECDCFVCHARGVMVSPAAMPTRARWAAPKLFSGDPGNSWERGVARHPNGLPFLGADLEPIGVHEWQTVGSGYLRRFQDQINAEVHPLAPTGVPDPSPQPTEV